MGTFVNVDWSSGSEVTYQKMQRMADNDQYLYDAAVDVFQSFKTNVYGQEPVSGIDRVRAAKIEAYAIHFDTVNTAISWDGHSLNIGIPLTGIGWTGNPIFVGTVYSVYQLACRQIDLANDLSTVTFQVFATGTASIADVIGDLHVLAIGP